MFSSVAHLCCLTISTVTVTSIPRKGTKREPGSSTTRRTSEPNLCRWQLDKRKNQMLIEYLLLCWLFILALNFLALSVSF